jgi:hypothetical protein
VSALGGFITQPHGTRGEEQLKCCALYLHQTIRSDQTITAHIGYHTEYTNPVGVKMLYYNLNVAAIFDV